MWQSINHLSGSSQCWGQCGVNVHHITTPEITANETTTAAATTWVWALQEISVYGFECFVVVEVLVFGVVVLYKQQQWWWSCWCSVGSQSGSDSPTVAIAIVCGRSSRSFSKSSNYSGLIFARKWRNARTSCRVMCQYYNVKTWRKVCSLQFVKRWKSMTNSSTQRSTSTCHEPNKDLSSSQLNCNSWRA